MTKHSKLRTEENPCETSSDYDFLSCVEDKLATAAGCRPPWTNLTPSASATPPVRVCSYHYHYYILSLSGQRVLLSDWLETAETLPGSYVTSRLHGEGQGEYFAFYISTKDVRHFERKKEILQISHFFNNFLFKKCFKQNIHPWEGNTWQSLWMPEAL